VKLFKPKTCDEWEQQISDSFATVLLNFVRIRVQPVSSMLQKCMQNAGAYVKIWH